MKMSELSDGVPLRDVPPLPFVPEHHSQLPNGAWTVAPVCFMSHRLSRWKEVVDEGAQIKAAGHEVMTIKLDLNRF